MYEHGTPYESNNRYFSARVSVKYNNQFYTWDSKYVSGFSISENLSNGNALAMGTINSSRLELELVQITGTYEHRLYKNIPIKVELAVMDGLPAGVSTFGLYSSRPSTGDEHRLYCVPSGNTYDKYMYVDGAWETVTYADPYVLNLGVFYIDDVEFGEYHSANVKSAKITAYDGFYLTERKFTSALTNPTIRSLIAEIATTCGLIGYNSSDWSNTITVSAYPEDATMRTMIGYLAGLQGTCAYFNRSGQLGAKWYTKAQYTEDETTYDFVVGRDTQYANSFVFGKSSDISGDITIKYLESGTGDNIITYPNNGVIGESISFENPLMDATQLQAIYADKVSADGTNYKITYTPLSVKWKGNATIETGEIVKVETSVKSGSSFVNTDCYIMERTMTYDGGFSEEYKCYGENEQTISFSTNVSMQKLERKLTNMEQAIEEATSVISQTEGSVFELISANDPTDPTKNAGWLLYSTDPFKQNVIKADANGIGFSSNGGESFNAVGIWIDSQGVGHILANDIVAGQVSTDKLIVGTSTDPTTLSALVNSTKQTADSAYNTQAVPEFWASGSNTTTSHFCIPGQNSTSTVSTVNSSFRIRQGSTILVHMTTSSQGGTSTGQKYLRVCYNQYGHGSGYTGGSYPCTDVYKTDGTLYGSLPSSSQFITTIDLPIYYNGKPLLKNSPDLWAANTDVAFTWEGTHWAMSYSIPTTQTEGQSILSTDNMKIAEYCSANDTTFIDGGKIYTGSITATQIAARTITGNEIKADTITADKLKANSITTRELSVGWQSGNLAASQWGNPSYSDDEYIQITIDDNGNQKLTVLQSFTSSQKSIYSAPFFIAEGAIIEMSATSFNISGASGSEISIWLQKSSSINGTYTTISRAEGYAGDAFIGRSSSTTVLSASYAVNGDSYYRLKAVGTYLNTNANAMNIYVTYKVTGNMIVTGRISSGDGNTYFDLDSSEIATRSSSFQSVLNSGGLIQHRKSSGYYYEMGYVQPVVFNSDYYTAIAYKPSYSSGITIGYDDGNYNRIVEIKQGTASSGGIMTVASDRFCSVVNRRDTSWGTFYSKCGVGDVTDGVGTNRDSVSIALENSSNVTVARLNVIPDWGAAGGIAINGRGKLGSGSATDSAFLEMGTSSLYWNGALVSSGSSESLKKNITEYTGNATDLITSAKIYSFLYNEEDDKDPARYGVVIERECPTEIVEKTNKAISVYSMTSMAWKAIQELNNKIEKLEAIVNDGKSAKETS